MNKQKLIERIEARPSRSAWERGVKAYAVDMLEDLPGDEVNPETLKQDLLNGAHDWHMYSEGGCALAYSADIAERLCNPSELKRTRNRDRNPNSREDWIQCQARALFQAWGLIRRAVKS